ncbi:MAG: ComF family protein [Alphaproteobacteria bacterium]
MTAVAKTLDIIFPPQCLICRTRVMEHGTLCTGCWGEIKFIATPYCSCCGLPFEYAMGDDALCGECIANRPVYSRCRSAFCYDEHSSKLVTALKFSDQMHLAVIYGKWLAKAGKEIIHRSDAIVPVPLHWRRFVKRRYNQSALLARSLARHTGLPVLEDGLQRVKHTPPQTGLSREQRLKNLQGAIVIHRKHAESFKGKSVLLIDDVLTTGSTINQCSKVLLRGGVSTVNVLTLARRV